MSPEWLGGRAEPAHIVPPRVCATWHAALAVAGSAERGAREHFTQCQYQGKVHVVLSGGKAQDEAHAELKGLALRCATGPLRCSRIGRAAELTTLRSVQTTAASQMLKRAARAGQSAVLLGCAHSPHPRLALRRAGWGVGAAGRRQGIHIVAFSRVLQRVGCEAVLCAPCSMTGMPAN